MKIDGKGAVTHEILQDFMCAKINNIKVDEGVAQKYLDEIENGGTFTDDMDYCP